MRHVPRVLAVFQRSVQRRSLLAATGLTTAGLALLGVAGSDAADAHRPAPRLTELRCVPASAAACRPRPQVRIGRQVQLRGSSLRKGMRVTFRWARGALATKLRRTRAGWVVRVPPGTRTGTVRVSVRDRAGRRSNALRLRVLPAAPAARRPEAPTPPGTLPAAFRGRGMWIWQLSRTEGGDLDAIAARAHAAGIQTVFVKSSDGTNRWPQWASALVAALHERGLRACAWQFVYGDDPEGEARVGADAVAQGADCLVIDAETRYQGRYAQAQLFLRALRAAVGPDFPLGLTSFPYVDYHPRLPYSVFLGPGGAQANVPQVYWKDIGGTVDAVSAHTLAHNRIFGVPIAPLGQTYQHPAPEEIIRFRAVWGAYRSEGYSWWSWQATPLDLWPALGGPEPAPAAVPDPGWPALVRGAKGDEVIVLQLRLATVDPSVAIDGVFSGGTLAALRAFQDERGLPDTGTTDPATWEALLAVPPRVPDWTVQPAPRAARASGAGAAAPDAVVDRPGR